jgi:hypothetical protein
MIQPFKASKWPEANPLTLKEIREQDVIRALETISAQIFEVAELYVKISQMALHQVDKIFPHREEPIKQ